MLQLTDRLLVCKKGRSLAHIIYLPQHVPTTQFRNLSVFPRLPLLFHAPHFAKFLSRLTRGEGKLRSR
jgi:hypothetical protein